MRVFLVAAALLVPLQAAAAPPEELENSGPGIFNGMTVPQCGWPTTVAVTAGGGLCTGTLVHPRVVIYAAHCGGGNKTIRFSESAFSGGQSIGASCQTNPGWNGPPGDDYAVCVLNQDAPIPPTPIAMGCEVDQLSPGDEVVIAGFGAIMGMDQTATGSGTKRWDTTTLTGISKSTAVVEMDGYCQGDSGGPSFIQMADGSWRTLSIVSQGVCGGGGLHMLASEAVGWFEQVSGYDISPCFDGDEWAPTSECQGFFAGDQNGSGSWGNWCAGTPASGSAATCGPPFDAPPDSDPPVVTITSPSDGSEYPDAPTILPIEIDADDGNGQGVKEVRLMIDGMELPDVDTWAPWRFASVEFPQGVWEVVALAEDWAGNVGMSAPITIGVAEEIPEEPGDTGDETGAETDTETGSGDDDGDEDTGDTEDDAGEVGTGTTGDPGSDDVGDPSTGCACDADPTQDPLEAVAWAFLALLWVRRTDPKQQRAKREEP